MHGLVTFNASHFVEADENMAAGTFAGAMLASYLVSCLRSEGLLAEDAARDEFAWTFDCMINGRTFWIHVGHYPSESDPQGWLVVVNSTLSGIQRVLKRTDEVEMDALCQILHQVLNEDPEINAIMWHTEEQFNHSDTSGTSKPS